MTAAVRARSFARRSLARLTRWLGSPRESARRAARHAQVGPAHLWQMKRDFQRDFLLRQGLAPHHHLLDLGCGTLRGGIPLIAHLESGHYTGIEARAEVLAEARLELREVGLEDRRPALLHCTDLPQLSLRTRFDFIWCFSVLIHMEDAIAADALAFAARHLSEAGALLANVNEGIAPERDWQGFPVVTRPLAFYAELAARAGLEMRSLGTLAELGHVSGNAAADTQILLRFARGRAA
jgi:2-polyprenyl-3-methyl-5-hydroxy-6-metoxy-1,4-benzoquinol methylase